MGTRLFVGNLSYNVTEQELKEVFVSESIEVRSVRVAMDRDTGRPRGFAFVETATEEGAKQSIEKIGGRLIQGRPVVIEEAQARPTGGGPRPGGPGARPGMGPGGPPRGPGMRPGGPPGSAGPRPGGAPGSMGPGGPPRSFGPPRPPGPGGFDPRGPDRKPETRRERPEKKKSTRPKPEERERGNWHWSGILDDD